MLERKEEVGTKTGKNRQLWGKKEDMRGEVRAYFLPIQREKKRGPPIYNPEFKKKRMGEEKFAFFAWGAKKGSGERGRNRPESKRREKAIQEGKRRLLSFVYANKRKREGEVVTVFPCKSCGERGRESTGPGRGKILFSFS